MSINSALAALASALSAFRSDRFTVAALDAAMNDLYAELGVPRGVANDVNILKRPNLGAADPAYAHGMFLAGDNPDDNARFTDLREYYNNGNAVWYWRTLLRFADVPADYDALNDRLAALGVELA